MSYEVLARKWRPRRFEDLVGQGHVVRALVNALDNDRLHHAFLFTGTRGVGKTTIARILAKSLNCERGVSSRPCGECSTCREVDEGRFVDLIEVDAASRTKVDDTRELLDNVQYAPTRGRYKVYLIDEVHMLSGHSFNALLKTLEEPPPHVKFLLATTDPQKLPVTVLSRCLQFSLKRINPEPIAAQLQKILEAEGITYDQPSLAMLARSADGSMRDALSLLDQAIAFGAGAVGESDVREMLGTIDQGSIDQLLHALGDNDPAAILAVVAGVAEYSGDYEALLDALLLALHKVSLVQADPALSGEIGETHERLVAHAQRITPEDVQLFYQIGLHGKRDLPLAPDPRSGLEMALLRMVAFRPAQVTTPPQPPTVTPPSRPTSKAPPAAGHRAEQSAAADSGAHKPSTQSATSPVVVPATPVTQDGVPPVMTTPSTQNWSAVVEQLAVTGLLRELVNHTALQAREGDALHVILDKAYAQLLNKERETEFKRALEAHFGRTLQLTVRIGKPQAETPAQERVRATDERQQAAEQAIAEDPNVRALQDSFNARVIPDTIRSRT